MEAPDPEELFLETLFSASGVALVSAAMKFPSSSSWMSSSAKSEILFLGLPLVLELCFLSTFGLL
jgi:hypothetical protein